MKKLLSILMLLVAIVTGAKAATETLSGADATSSKDNPIVKTSFTMLSTYNPSGSTTINSKSCLKVRWARSDSSTGNTEGFALKVNSGYKITNVEAQMSGNAGTVTLSKITIDGTAYTGSYSKTINASNASGTKYTNITLSGIEATQYINFERDAESAKDQGFVYLTVTYVSTATKVATPTCTLGAWDAVNGKYAVTLNCTTAGHTIKYSTDNKVSYSDYSTALALAPGTTLDAYAVKEGLDNSDNMAQYTVPAAPSYFTVTYAKAGDVDGVVPPADADIESGSQINVPKNFTMYKEGFTFKGWDANGDETVDYAGGAKYTVTANATLTAVFEPNTVSLDDRTAATTLTFDFLRQNGAPTVQWGEGSGAHIWVTQATVAGETIDVKADINVTASGKFNNAGWTDWIQINKTTEITVPSAENATVKIRVYDDKNATTVNGEERASIASSVATYNVTATGATALIVADNGEGNAYYKYVQVVLPKPAGLKAAAPVYKLHDGSTYVSEISTNKYIFKGENAVKFRVKAQPYTYVTYTVGENSMPAAPTLTSGTAVDNRTGSSEKESGNINEKFDDHTKKYYVRAIAWDSDKDPESASEEVVLVVYANKITLNASGFATYSSACDFEYADADAYGMKLTATSLQGTKVTTGKIAAGEGILFKGTAGATVTITKTTGAKALENNSLIGTTDASNNIISPLSYTYKYALSGDTFKKLTGDLVANKAFFGTNVELSNSLDLVFDGATAINNVNANDNANSAAPVKVIKNGQLYIGNYNVAGARIK